eukprot:scaffold58308_cov32-Tisochrysis_lutea.AAC.3
MHQNQRLGTLSPRYVLKARRQAIEGRGTVWKISCQSLLTSRHAVAVGESGSCPESMAAH